MGASAFVNAFVNAGFGEDKLMLVEGGVKQSWIWKVKEDGMISTAASAGMLMLWDVEMGLDKMDAYTYVPEDQIKAGAALGMGVMNSGVRLDSQGPHQRNGAEQGQQLPDVEGLRPCKRLPRRHLQYVPDRARQPLQPGLINLP